jgi:phage-related protein
MTASWDSSVNLQPSYGTTKGSQPIVRQAQFGSGYQQVGSLGINQNPKTFSLTYDLSEAESDTVETFLDARGGIEKFTFTPPGESSSMKVRCSAWSKTMPTKGRVQLTTTFVQVFEA